MGHWDAGQGFAMVDQRDDEDLTQGSSWGKHEKYLGGKIIRTRSSPFTSRLLNDVSMAVPNGGGRINKHENENIKPRQFSQSP